jgi:hypothetical protein
MALRLLLGASFSKKEDRAMSAVKVTTDHQEIRKWVEARGGKPAHVKRTARGKGPGMLRIDYPGFSDEETLEPMSWAQWFRAFDANDLAFVHQDAVKGGRKSRVSRLVARGSAATGRRGSAAKRTATTRSAAGRSVAKRGAVKRGTVKRATVKRATVKPGTAARTRAAKRIGVRSATKSAGAVRTTKRPSTARKARTMRKTPRAAAGRMAKRTGSQPSKDNGKTTKTAKTAKIARMAKSR